MEVVQLHVASDSIVQLHWAIITERLYIDANITLYGYGCMH
jgi:hypothetical protein